MKKITYIVAMIAIIGAMVLILMKNKKSNQQETDMAAEISMAVPVKIDIVKEEKFTLNFTSNGILEPVNELTFVSDVSGRILHIPVDKGMPVIKGQTLALIDDEMLKADYDASEASYIALKTDYERFKNANEKGGVTDQQMDNIRTQLIAAESRFNTSKRRLADATVKSPISGIINERYIQVGSYLNPGARLFDIVDDSQLKLRCFVSETQVLKIKKGQQANIRCNAFPEENIIGNISFIGVKADRGLSYPIEIVIINKNELKSGMYVTALFKSKEDSKGLFIPRNAVSGSVRSANVYVVKNGYAQKHDVIIGSMIDKKVEILSGLQAGDSIVVSGLINISEGSRVVNKIK